MSIFDVLGDAAKAVGHAVERVGDRASDAGGWFGDLFEGNLGEQAVPQSELVKQIMASKGAPDWHGGADQAAELAEQHAQVSGLTPESVAATSRTRTSYFVPLDAQEARWMCERRGGATTRHRAGRGGARTAHARARRLIGVRTSFRHCQGPQASELPLTEPIGKQALDR
ncbi:MULTISPECIES: hypothetical protein [Amycolatopsis]|uniref:Uncharacterized protein n=1 Tax=Amycolatopsis echigonensis TaxID=2576905 RepID=A0A8E1VUC2_9PSEU|nr:MULTISPECIES: hypothetical protein [Amycolatopsis]MBB2498457.1 hypothetical protein [Amycolatopsis echigonensis]